MPGPPTEGLISHLLEGSLSVVKDLVIAECYTPTDTGFTELTAIYCPQPLVANHRDSDGNVAERVVDIRLARAFSQQHQLSLKLAEKVSNSRSVEWCYDLSGDDILEKLTFAIASAIAIPVIVSTAADGTRLLKPICQAVIILYSSGREEQSGPILDACQALGKALAAAFTLRTSEEKPLDEGAVVFRTAIPTQPETLEDPVDYAMSDPWKTSISGLIKFAATTLEVNQVDVVFCDPMSAVNLSTSDTPHMGKPGEFDSIIRYYRHQLPIRRPRRPKSDDGVNSDRKPRVVPEDFNLGLSSSDHLPTNKSSISTEIGDNSKASSTTSKSQGTGLVEPSSAINAMSNGITPLKRSFSQGSSVVSAQSSVPSIPVIPGVVSPLSDMPGSSSSLTMRILKEIRTTSTSPSSPFGSMFSPSSHQLTWLLPHDMAARKLPANDWQAIAVLQMNLPLNKVDCELRGVPFDIGRVYAVFFWSDLGNYCATRDGTEFLTLISGVCRVCSGLCVANTSRGLSRSQSSSIRSASSTPREKRSNSVSTQSSATQSLHIQSHSNSGMTLNSEPKSASSSIVNFSGVVDPRAPSDSPSSHHSSVAGSVSKSVQAPENESSSSSANIPSTSSLAQLADLAEAESFSNMESLDVKVESTSTSAPVQATPLQHQKPRSMLDLLAAAGEGLNPPDASGGSINVTSVDLEGGGVSSPVPFASSGGLSAGLSQLKMQHSSMSLASMARQRHSQMSALEMDEDLQGSPLPHVGSFPHMHGNMAPLGMKSVYFSPSSPLLPSTSAPPNLKKTSGTVAPGQAQGQGQGQDLAFSPLPNIHGSSSMGMIGEDERARYFPYWRASGSRGSFGASPSPTLAATNSTQAGVTPPFNFVGEGAAETKQPLQSRPGSLNSLSAAGMKSGLRSASRNASSSNIGADASAPPVPPMVSARMLSLEAQNTNFSPFLHGFPSSSSMRGDSSVPFDYGDPQTMGMPINMNVPMNMMQNSSYLDILGQDQQQFPNQQFPNPAYSEEASSYHQAYPRDDSSSPPSSGSGVVNSAAASRRSRKKSRKLSAPSSLHPSEHLHMTNVGLPAVSAAALARVKGRSRAPKPKLSVALRRGKWSKHEENFTNVIIAKFRDGLLPLAEGTTLRTYLSGQLHCAPMRITKKFAKDLSIGKQVYVRRPVLEAGGGVAVAPNAAGAPLSASEWAAQSAEAVEAVLQARADFYASVLQMQSVDLAGIAPDAFPLDGVVVDTLGASDMDNDEVDSDLDEDAPRDDEEESRESTLEASFAMDPSVELSAVSATPVDAGGPRRGAELGDSALGKHARDGAPAFLGTVSTATMTSTTSTSTTNGGSAAGSAGASDPSSPRSVQSPNTLPLQSTPQFGRPGLNLPGMHVSLPGAISELSLSNLGAGDSPSVVPNISNPQLDAQTKPTFHFSHAPPTGLNMGSYSSSPGGSYSTMFHLAVHNSSNNSLSALANSASVNNAPTSTSHLTGNSSNSTGNLKYSQGGYDNYYGVGIPLNKSYVSVMSSPNRSPLMGPNQGSGYGYYGYYGGSGGTPSFGSYNSAMVSQYSGTPTTSVNNNNNISGNSSGIGRKTSTGSMLSGSQRFSPLVRASVPSGQLSTSAIPQTSLPPHLQGFLNPPSKSSENDQSATASVTNSTTTSAFMQSDLGSVSSAPAVGGIGFPSRTSELSLGAAAETSLTSSASPRTSRFQVSESFNNHVAAHPIVSTIIAVSSPTPSASTTGTRDLNDFDTPSSRRSSRNKDKA